MGALTLLMVVSLAWQAQANSNRDWIASGIRHQISTTRLPAPQTHATRQVRRVTRERFTGITEPRRDRILASRASEPIAPSCDFAAPHPLIELHLDLPPPAQIC